MRVEVPGFKAYEQGAFKLEVNDTIQAEVSLQIGDTGVEPGLSDGDFGQPNAIADPRVFQFGGKVFF